MNDIIVPQCWIELAHIIDTYEDLARVFILGGNDTGKSYLCRYLTHELCKRGKSVALIDTDPGQSLLGPPSTVAMALYRHDRPKDGQGYLFQEPDPIDSTHALVMGFVGSVTPVGSFLQVLVGLQKLIDRAITYRVSTIIINTSGLISGTGGSEFKFQKIDLVNPTHLITLERAGELKYIVKNFSSRPLLTLKRLGIASAVRRKTPDERTAYRKRLFKQYFKDAHSLSLSLFSYGLHGRVPDLHYFTQWKNMVVGLCDERNYALGLACVESLTDGKLQCITPLKNMKKIKSIQLSSFYLDP